MFFLANGKYNSNLSAGYTAGQTTLSVNDVPDNVPTYVTIAFWAYPVTSSANNSIFTANTDDGANRCNLHFPWGNKNIYWDWGNISAGGRLSTVFSDAWLNTWSHYAFTVKSGTGMAIYKNGALLASNATTSTFTAGTKTLELGRYGGTVYWNGRFDDFMIFNAGLSATEIEILYRVKLKKLSGVSNV